MKKTVLFLFAMLASVGVFSQIVLLNENMDSYTVNSFLGIDNPTWFSTWSNQSGSGEDAQILANFAHSGTKSASADLNGGPTDCILKLGNKTTGVYELKWWMYVENGKCAHYNIQHFQTVGIEWAFEIYFRTNGTLHLHLAGTILNGTYPKATWFEVKNIINLDVDSIYSYINGTLLHSWPFHWTNVSPTGTKKLGAVDFWAGAEGGSGETPGFNFDDVSFKQLGTLPPTVVTMAATEVTGNSATLNGTVNPNIMSTTVTFDYGLTTAYGSTVAGVPAIVSGNATTPVSADLAGLLPGNTYHYRIHGVNSNGATDGEDMTFTTVVTGIDSPQTGTISVFPNPNNGKFTLKISSSKQESFNISVINNIGLKIMEIENFVSDGNIEKNIDLHSVPSGTYFIVIRNNESTVVKKMLVIK